MDPNRSTDYTTATYNLSTVILSAHSLTNIFTSRPHFPATSGGSVPQPANCCQWRTKFVPINGTKRLPSLVSHMPKIPAPYAPTPSQTQTSVTSSPSRMFEIKRYLAGLGKHTLSYPFLINTFKSCALCRAEPSNAASYA